MAHLTSSLYHGTMRNNRSLPVDIMICPQCRRRSDRPMFLPRSQQIIFDFIWNHPWSTVHEIEDGTQGNPIPVSNLVNVQISKIRTNLVGTPFRLIDRPAPRPRHDRGHKQYRIEEVNVTP